MKFIPAGRAHGSESMLMHEGPAARSVRLDFVLTERAVYQAG